MIRYIYIDNELQELTKRMISLQNDIHAPRRDKSHANLIKYLTYFRNKSKIQIATYVKQIITYNDDNAAYQKYYLYYLDFLRTAEHGATKDTNPTHDANKDS